MGEGDLIDQYARVVPDLPRSFLGSETFRKKLRDLLSADAGDTSTANSTVKKIVGVTRREFAALTYILEERSSKRPRLSYVPQGVDGTAIIQWPLEGHEAVLQEFSDRFSRAVAQIPINEKIFRLRVEKNHKFGSCDGFRAIPDLSVRLVPMKEAPGAYKLLAIAELAFSQNRDALLLKVKDELRTRPEIILVVLIFVNEKQEFRGPGRGSEAWKLYSGEEKSRGYLEFFNHGQRRLDFPGGSGFVGEDLPKVAQDCFEVPTVSIAGHVWCDISSVEFEIWVQDDAGIIDIDNDACTSGMLYPTLAMDDVEVKLKEAVLKMKSAITGYAKVLELDADTHQLETSKIEFSIDWTLMRVALNAAANETAFSRYQDWHYRNFQDHDELFHPNHSPNPGTTSGSPRKRTRSAQSNASPGRVTRSQASRKRTSSASAPGPCSQKRKLD